MPCSILRLAILTIASTLQPLAASSATITFDYYTDLQAINNQIAGAIFANATVLTAGMSLNELEFPPHSNPSVVFDDGGPITIVFNQPITSFFSYFTYSHSLSLTALGANGEVITTQGSLSSSNLAISGDAGSTPNEIIKILAPGGFTSLLIAGDPQGSSFVMDDVTFETLSSVPEAAPEWLLLSGLTIILGQLVIRRILIHRRRRVSTFLGVALMLVGAVGSKDLSAQSVGVPTITPPVLQADESITFVVAADVALGGRTLIPNGVTAYVEDDEGKLVLPLGVLNDTGTGGDFYPSDGRFSGTFHIKWPIPSDLRIRVSAAFFGLIRRAVSPAGTLLVADAVKSIGNSGGELTVTSPDSTLHGAQITVPPGAVATPVVFSLLATSWVPDQSHLPVGPVIRMGPSGMSFSQPILVTIPYADQDNDGQLDGTDINETDVRAYTSSNGADWSPASIIKQDDSANTVTIIANHFSYAMCSVAINYTKYWSMASRRSVFPAESSQSVQWQYEFYNNGVYIPEAIIESRRLPRFGVSLSSQLAYSDGGTDNLGAQLKIFETGQKTKIRSAEASSNGSRPGVYMWRVFVPQFPEKFDGGIGAFLYNDSTHELDFEIGHGTDRERSNLGAQPNEGILYLVSQGHCILNGAWKQTESKLGCYQSMTLQTGIFHTFELRLEETPSHQMNVTWLVDAQKKGTTLTHNYLGTFPFYIMASAESIPDYYGPRAAYGGKSLTAHFDTIAFGQAHSPAQDGLPSVMLLSEDFSDGVANEWVPLRQGWKVENGVYKSTNTECCYAVESYYSKGSSWTDYTITSQFSLHGTYAPSDAELIFRYQPPASGGVGVYGNYGACQILQDYGGTRLQVMDTKAPAQFGLEGKFVPVSLVQGFSYTLVATVKGDRATCEIKEIPGAKVESVTGPFNPTGTVGLRGTHVPVWFDNLTVVSQ